MNLVDVTNLRIEAYSEHPEIYAFAAGVADSHIAAIGGWSGKEFGLSDHMLEYGSEGLSDSETVRSLT